MQLTNVQVINVMQGLGKLAQEKLPVKLSWKITTALRSLEPFTKTVDETMAEIRKKYANKDQFGNFVEAIDSDGKAIPNTITIPTEKLAEFNGEVEDLLNQTVEVHNVTLKISDFPDTMTLEPVALNALAPILLDE